VTTHPDTTSEPDLEVTPPKTKAAGLPAVAKSLGMAVKQMGAGRTARNLMRLNQVEGFDCMSCAWPDPDPKHRHTAEFCETAPRPWRRRATPAGSARSSSPSTAWPIWGRAPSTGWASRAGSPSPWCAATAAPTTSRSAGTTRLRWSRSIWTAWRARTRRCFYTSGRASNESAFVYQLFARAYGTNNLPDCSNMCHESTSVGLADTIGIGKGSVSLDDIHEADLIIISGQNPGTNHPRMLSALEIAKSGGVKIIAINPLREAGLLGFLNPQKPAGLIGKPVDLADHFLQVRSDGDLALWQALGHLLQRGVADREFILHGELRAERTPRFVADANMSAVFSISSQVSPVAASTSSRPISRRCSEYAVNPVRPRES